MGWDNIWRDKFIDWHETIVTRYPTCMYPSMHHCLRITKKKNQVISFKLKTTEEKPTGQGDAGSPSTSTANKLSSPAPQLPSISMATQIKILIMGSKTTLNCNPRRQPIRFVKMMSAVAVEINFQHISWVIIKPTFHLETMKAQITFHANGISGVGAGHAAKQAEGKVTLFNFPVMIHKGLIPCAAYFAIRMQESKKRGKRSLKKEHQGGGTGGGG